MKDTTVTSRIPSHVRAGLEARADHEGITVSLLAARVLTQAVNRWGTKTPAVSPTSADQPKNGASNGSRKHTARSAERATP